MRTAEQEEKNELTFVGISRISDFAFTAPQSAWLACRNDVEVCVRKWMKACSTLFIFFGFFAPPSSSACTYIDRSTLYSLLVLLHLFCFLRQQRGGASIRSLDDGNVPIDE